MRDTVSVQTLLANYNQVPAVEQVVQRLPSSQVGALDERHWCALRKLLTRSAWMRSELCALARQLDLMPLACIGSLNKWALDQYGDLLLVEEEQLLTVNENLKQKLEK